MILLFIWINDSTTLVVEHIFFSIYMNVRLIRFTMFNVSAFKTVLHFNDGNMNEQLDIGQTHNKP